MFDCVFLDLFAGSGGIGIEALSRGAREAVFVENNPKAMMCVKDNLKFTKLEGKAVTLTTDVMNALYKLEGEKVFDYIFLDPPYDRGFEKRGLHERDVHVDRRTGDLAGQHEPEPHIHHYKAASQQNALSDKLGMFDQRADAEKTGKRKGHIKKNDDERRPVGRRPRLGQAGIDDEKILHADGRDICQPKRQALKI